MERSHLFDIVKGKVFVEEGWEVGRLYKEGKEQLQAIVCERNDWKGGKCGQELWCQFLELLFT